MLRRFIVGKVLNMVWKKVIVPSYKYGKRFFYVKKQKKIELTKKARKDIDKKM